MSDMREAFEEVATRLGFDLRPDDPASKSGEYASTAANLAYDIWEHACEWQAVGAQGEEYPSCDTCGKSIDYMPWHYSNGISKHLHACDKCWLSISPTQGKSALQAKNIIDEVIAGLEGGFVVCGRCGDQEDTATLDCMSDLRKLQAIISESAQGVAEPVAKVRVSESTGDWAGSHVGVEWLAKHKVNDGDELFTGPAGARGAAEPAADNRREFWQKLSDFVDDYIDGYEFRGDGDYTPNAKEQFLIEDCVAGLLCELSDGGFLCTRPPGAGAPEGWKIEPTRDGAIAISHPDIGGYISSFPGCDSRIAEVILHALATALQQPPKQEGEGNE